MNSRSKEVLELPIALKLSSDGIVHPEELFGPIEEQTLIGDDRVTIIPPKGFLASVFGRLIDLLAGNTVELSSDTYAKYNPVSESNNIIPKFNKETSYDVIGSRTEFVGNKTTENAATYTYEDPVAE